jgi:hypothetical protein
MCTKCGTPVGEQDSRQMGKKKPSNEKWDALDEDAHKAYSVHIRKGGRTRAPRVAIDAVAERRRKIISLWSSSFLVPEIAKIVGGSESSVKSVIQRRKRV